MIETTTSSPSLVGRSAELTQIDELLARGRSAAATMAVIGEPGIGKSELLRSAMNRAQSVGARVLWAAGAESEVELPFAALHQLLRPVIPGIDRIPPRQATALRTAFGMSDDVIPDPLLIGIATLSLLADAADEGPILVAVDDVHVVDRASLDALTFAIRRFEAERIAVILASRREEVVATLGRAGVMELRPLDAQACEALLVAHLPSLRGPIRRRILDECGGNPLALLELARVSRDQGKGDRVQPAALPSSSQMERLFGHRLRSLPKATRRVLVIAAASGGQDIRLVLRAAASLGLGPDSLQAAEEAGLMVVTGDLFGWRHPLVRAALDETTRTTERREAHAALASVLTGEPVRRAWHLAAMVEGPDEVAASALEVAADESRKRSGLDSAARALERAADLSPAPEDQARRLAAAARLGIAAGSTDWVRALGERIEAASTDPILLAQAALCRAHVRAAQGHDDRPAMTGDELLAGLAADPATGIATLAISAAIAQTSDDHSLRTAVQVVTRSLPGSGGEPWRLYCLAASDASGPASDFVPHLARAIDETTGDPEMERLLAFTCFFLDQFDIAKPLLRSIADYSRHHRPSDLPTILQVLSLADLAQGRWRDALAFSAEAEQLAAHLGQHMLVAGTLSVQALIAAMSGDGQRVAERSEAATRASRDTIMVAHTAWSRGLEALGARRFAEAQDHLMPIITPGSAAAHQSVALWAAGDIAAAAGSSRDEVLDTALARLHARAGQAMSSRSRVTTTRALALRAAAGEADERFIAALSVDGAAQWPFEMARTQLSYGEWLRRNDRPHDARPLLRDATATFTALGAHPWTEQARAELRSAGGTTSARGRATVDELTPQQRQVAQLAARGLSNGEIATQLFLSPRTVGFHLYNAFPKLGVSTRMQLARALASIDAPDAHLLGDTA